MKMYQVKVTVDAVQFADTFFACLTELSECRKEETKVNIDNSTAIYHVPEKKVASFCTFVDMTDCATAEIQ